MNRVRILSLLLGCIAIIPLYGMADFSKNRVTTTSGKSWKEYSHKNKETGITISVEKSWSGKKPVYTGYKLTNKSGKSFSEDISFGEAEKLYNTLEELYEQ